jgi:hypothetical protein
MAITLDDVNVSWVAAVTAFIEESPWLTKKHLPQLKALLAIAQDLDMPGQKAKTAALISQFTLTQRTLLGKAPETGAEQDQLPGLDVWDPEAVDAGYGGN